MSIYVEMKFLGLFFVCFKDQAGGQEVKRNRWGKEGERGGDKKKSAVIEHQMTALTHALKMSWNGLKLLPWMMRWQVSYPLSDP